MQTQDHIFMNVADGHQKVTMLLHSGEICINLGLLNLCEFMNNALLTLFGQNKCFFLNILKQYANSSIISTEGLPFRTTTNLRLPDMEEYASN